MPGSSLWLVPSEDSDLYRAVTQLICKDVPSAYPVATPPQFSPHITLTPVTETTQPPLEQSQKWLDALTLPDTTSNVKVAIHEVEVGTIFFKKITMRCAKTPELCDLAAYCHAAGVGGEEDLAKAKDWVRESYLPHMSLMYSDLPSDEITSKLHDVKATVSKAKQTHTASKTAKGGAIWLVPTYKSIEDWKPVAIRHLPDIEWEWET